MYWSAKPVNFIKGCIESGGFSGASVAGGLETLRQTLSLGQSLAGYPDRWCRHELKSCRDGQGQERRDDRRGC